jgi:hypothetical protein
LVHDKKNQRWTSGVNGAKILSGETQPRKRYLVKSTLVRLQPHFVDIQDGLGADTVLAFPIPRLDPMMSTTVENLSSALTVSGNPSAAIGYSTARHAVTGPYLHSSFSAGTGKIEWMIDAQSLSDTSGLEYLE